MTRALLEAGASVLAIEKDERCRPVLAELAAAYPGQLDTLERDALNVDIAALGQLPRRVVANLPYNIGTELLVRWLNRPDAFESLTVMVQKEVALRLAAEPGTRAYGRLSIFAGWRWSVQPAFDVSAKAFTPPPKVDSTVVHIRPLDAPKAEADAETLARVTAAAFGQRRKMLRTSLKPLGDAEALCGQASLDPTLRAERVSIEGFCALARAVAKFPVPKC